MGFISLVILLGIIISIILVEIVNINDNDGNFIIKSGHDLLIEELVNGGGLADYYDKIIMFYDSKTILNINSIKPITSLIFSYVVSTNDYKIKYLVFKYSKSHYKIKEKYIFLNENSNKIKPLKFK